MGDRLTLETADGALVVLFVYEDHGKRRDMRVVVTASEAVAVEEHKGRDALGVDVWMRVDIDDHDGMPSEWVEMVARALAWAYRERLPASDDARGWSDETAHELRNQLANSCGWLGEDEDEYPEWDELLTALHAGFCKGSRRAPMTWVERGPTEGASDADVSGLEWLLEQARGRVAVAHAAVAIPSLFAADAVVELEKFLGERPPTGGASPDEEPHTEGLALEPCSYAPVGYSLAWCGQELRWWWTHLESRDEGEPWCHRADAANDAARDMRERLTGRIAELESSPEPSVPDAPGRWRLWGDFDGLSWGEVDVFDTPGGLVFQHRSGAPFETVSGCKWGGRCLRGAPARGGWAKFDALVEAVHVLTHDIPAFALDTDQVIARLRAALDTAKGETQAV